MAQTHYTAFTVNGGQVPSTQTNFPVLINVTDNRFKLIANGGRVANASGFDIRAYSDSALTSPLDYQLQTHSGITGLLTMRVKVPSLTNGSIIYLGYGDSALTSDGSTPVWDADFELVWRLNESSGGGSGTIFDSTANNNDGGDGSSGVTYSVTGKIHHAVSLDGVDDRIQYIASLSLTGDLTLSYWFATTDTVEGGRISDLSLAAAPGLQVAHDSTTGAIRIDNDGGVTTTIESGGGFNDGVFHKVDARRSGTTYELFLDGVSIGTSGGTAPTYDSIFLGTRFGFDIFTVVTLDEVKLSTIARSDDWLTTEFNNEDDFATFFTMGSEQEPGAGPRRLILSSPIG